MGAPSPGPLPPRGRLFPGAGGQRGAETQELQHRELERFSTEFLVLCHAEGKDGVPKAQSLQPVRLQVHRGVWKATFPPRGLKVCCRFAAAPLKEVALGLEALKSSLHVPHGDKDIGSVQSLNCVIASRQILSSIYYSIQSEEQRFHLELGMPLGAGASRATRPTASTVAPRRTRDRRDP